MRLILTLAVGLAFCLSSCDESPQTAPVAAVAPPASVPPLQTQAAQSLQQASPGLAHRGRHRAVRAWNGDDPGSAAEQTSQYEEEQHYSDGAPSSYREKHETSAGSWTDGFGRTHFYSGAAAETYAQRARDMAINGRSYLSPWHGYGEDCGRRSRD